MNGCGRSDDERIWACLLAVWQQNQCDYYASMDNALCRDCSVHSGRCMNSAAIEDARANWNERTDIRRKRQIPGSIGYD